MTNDQAEAAKKFLRTAFDIAFDGGAFDGSDIQELGSKLGLLVERTAKEAYEAGVVFDASIFDEDETVFILAPWLIEGDG